MDTSALVKRYVEEDGSSLVDDYYVSKNELLIAQITLIEFHSALHRKLGDKSIDSEAFYDATLSWNKEELFYRVISFDRQLCNVAISILKEHRVRTLDAIQMASALQQQLDEFVVSDKRLKQVAMELLPEKVTYI
jgi:uncharacterized protein